MEIVLLHNPHAGDKAVSAGRLIALFRREGFQARYSLLADALDDPAVLNAGDFVVVAGGDGSVRKVALLLAGTGRAIAALPLGTSNNIATSLGVRGTVEDVIAGLARPKRVQVDLGLARGPWGERRFVESAGFGLITQSETILVAIDDASDHAFSNRKERLFRNASVVTALAHVVPPIELSLSWEQEQRAGRFLLCEVMNIPRVGPGLELAGEAIPDDGLLNVVLVADDERAQLTSVLRKYFSRTDNVPRLTEAKAQRFTLRSFGGAIHIDDEILALDGNGASVEMEFSLQPRALEFLVPETEE